MRSPASPTPSTRWPSAWKKASGFGGSSSRTRPTSCGRRSPISQGYLEGLRDGVIPADEPTFISLSRRPNGWCAWRRRSTPSPPATPEGAATAGRPRPGRRHPGRRRTRGPRPGTGRNRARSASCPTGLRARADPDALAQVLGNLLQNASRYTPPGGRVTFGAERRAQDVLVSVVNTRRGIPAADLPHVFERFYRVDKSRDREPWRRRDRPGNREAACRRAGGTVGAESEAGCTRFWFSLPA